MSEHTFDFDSLDLSLEAVLHEMGYGKVKPGKEVIDILEAFFKDIATFVRPSCTFRLLEGKADESTVLLKNETILNVGTTIAKLLKESERFAIFVATAGIAFAHYQERIKAEGNMLRIFILDTIGSCIAEKVGDKMELLLEKEIANYSHTYRFSPGYCGWPLKDQKELFRILGDQPCSISLSDVYLMYPIKSISGIIGIGYNVKKKKYGCDICQLETCYKRKYKKI